MNNFTQRAITGAVFVVVLLGSILFNQYSFSALFLLITILGVWEFYRITSTDNTNPQKYTGTIIAAILFILSAWVAAGSIGFAVLFSMIPLVFLVLVAELYTKSERPFTNIGYTLLGIFYVALPFSLLNFIAFPEIKMMIGTEAAASGAQGYSPHILLGMIYMIWANDTGAYLVGRKLGKHRLFERISPKKSWEGSIGGAFFALLGSYVISIYYTDIAFMDWAVISLIVVVVGTLGDLVESLLKRSLNIKDSGTILPGHGGILDRFDSIILASPFVLLYIVLRFHV